MTFNEDWEREALNWAAWARTPGHDSYWRWSGPPFFELVPPPRRATLDLGCGEGRVARDLAARRHRVTGIDASPTLLELAREAHPEGRYLLADAAALPFDDASFDLVVAFNSLMDVQDMPGAVREAARVLEPDGVAVFVTPNRLTFARPDEIIDPYHYVEYGPQELRELCLTAFVAVELRGLFGSPRYLSLVAAEHARLDRLLARDPLRLRRLVPRRVRQRLYDRLLRRARSERDPRAAAIAPEDFELRAVGLDEALDLVAVCRRPSHPSA